MTWGAAAGIMVMMSAATKGKVRRRGRPRGGHSDDPRYQRAEELFCRGEIVTGDDGVPETQWPTLHAVSKKFGLVPQAVYYRAKRGNWRERRDLFRRRLDAKTDEAIADARASQTKDVVSILEAVVEQFAESVAERRLRTDNLSDLDRCVRLLEYLKTGSRRQERESAGPPLEELQQRYREARARREAVEGDSRDALAGVVSQPADVAVLPNVVALEGRIDAGSAAE